jgi:hypothetical protein
MVFSLTDERAVLVMLADSRENDRTDFLALMLGF